MLYVSINLVEIGPVDMEKKSVMNRGYIRGNRSPDKIWWARIPNSRLTYCRHNIHIPSWRGTPAPRPDLSTRNPTPDWTSCPSWKKTTARSPEKNINQILVLKDEKLLWNHLLSIEQNFSDCSIQILVTIWGYTDLVPWLGKFIDVIDSRIQEWSWFCVIWYVREHPLK